MNLVCDWLNTPHPTNQPIMQEIRKGHCDHRKVYTFYFSLLSIYKINYILDLVWRASEKPITC